jgi:hypothetical protein
VDVLQFPLLTQSGPRGGNAYRRFWIEAAPRSATALDRCHRRDSGSPLARFPARVLGSSRAPERAFGDSPVADSEKFRNALYKFQYLLLGFIAFGHLRRQPPTASTKQLFKGLADWRIGIKVRGDHAKSSVIPIRGRPVISANGMAQTLEQGV